MDVQPRTTHVGLPAPTISVEADASRFLDAAWSDLRAAALDNEMRSRREARNAADREAYRSASRVGQGSWDGPGVHPGRIVEVLRSVLPDNAIITTDAGNMGGWVARGYRFRRPGTFIGPTSGAMGFGLPAAIAASLQDPDRIAVAICGDGGFAMTMMELETSVREGAHPIVLVFDNERYGTIAASQAARGSGDRVLGARADRLRRHRPRPGRPWFQRERGRRFRAGTSRGHRLATDVGAPAAARPGMGLGGRQPDRLRPRVRRHLHLRCTPDLRGQGRRTDKAAPGRCLGAPGAWCEQAPAVRRGTAVEAARGDQGYPQLDGASMARRMASAS